jgi:predicted DCC family thiol-disulfide oxidoreductase YuxK
MAIAEPLESEQARRAATADGPIVFYDGDCGLCARSVQYVMRRDTKGLFRFAPLQGETAAKLLGPLTGPADTWTMLLVDQTGVYDRSTGALKILQHVKPGSFLPKLGLWVPRFLRDLVYRGIAKVRYRIWGKSDRCPLPTKAQMSRFMP